MVELGKNWEEELENELLDILDFPLEGDGVEEEVWDMSNSELLGPIPSNVLIGPPTLVNENINTGPPRGSVAPITGTPHQKQLSNHVSPSDSHIQESASFQIHSPIISVLESKPEKAIPVRSRSKRLRAVGVNPWLRLAAPKLSTSQKTVKTKKSIESKKCVHCESTKTPQWREGPLGPKTLCNACGVRYRSGRLFPEYRPASSPSFVPSKHSNAHKKVIEMRNKAKIKVAPMSSQPTVETDEPPSPQPEFGPMSSYLFDSVYWN